ncbi:MAG: hypothetical protein KGZ58_05330, partial [Ignavibacteriales bacterium]|nr:hypothetical protein [Ignavibacteriales bacterium]
MSTLKYSLAILLVLASSLFAQNRMTNRKDTRMERKPHSQNEQRHKNVQTEESKILDPRTHKMISEKEFRAQQEKLYPRPKNRTSANDISIPQQMKQLNGNSFMTGTLPQLWGMTRNGGASDAGTIFAMNTGDTVFNYSHSFPYIDGRNPYYNGVYAASNGKLYGTTPQGGRFERGTLYEYDPATNTYSTKHVFGYYISGSEGGDPYGTPVQASNGKLYGTTFYNVNNYLGGIYEYDITTDTYSFVHYNQNATNDGANSAMSLTPASNGKLYGVTYYGGVNSGGVIFEFDPATYAYTKIYDFDSANGSFPHVSLTQASNGKLYGITGSGGTNNEGGIFQFDISTLTYTKIFDFDSITPGVRGKLIPASNGKLYGVFDYGFSNNTYQYLSYGSIFEINPATNVFTTIYNFSDSTGWQPYNSVIQASNGKLYGTVSQGGPNDNNAFIFEYNLSTNTFTNIYNIDYENSSPILSVFAQTSNGKFYGTTDGNYPANYGTLMEFDLSSNIYSTEIEFGAAKEGAFPYGSLVQAWNTKLYGMTHSSGYSGYGVIFEVDPFTNTLTKKYNFDYDNGGYPYGTMALANNGKLYGMTNGGGEDGSGVIFEYDPYSNTYSKMHDFYEDNSGNGSEPQGGLLQASNGLLYGMTERGGANGAGIIFSMDITTNTFTKLHDFGTDGANPYGTLIQASNGKLYGVTNQTSGGGGGGGGEGKNLSGNGVLFAFDISTNTYSKLHDFVYSTEGGNPYGSLMFARNGKLYGLNYGGGNSGYGTLYEFDITTNTLTVKYSFTGYEDGAYPYGSLMQAKNGKLYGFTNDYGGSGGGEKLSNDPRGTLFEYDTATSTLTKKFTFTTPYGLYPYGELTEVDSAVTLTINATNGSVTNNFDNRTTFAKDAKAILTATANTNYHFVNWSGDLSGTENPDTIIMSGNKNVTANFAIDTHILTVNITGQGSVEIFTSPTVTVSNASNQVSIAYGTVFPMFATPATGYDFANWQYNAGFNSA